jgi:acyl-CoA reductase-like NAD-dependent aldehyde dehydrogenase
MSQDVEEPARSPRQIYIGGEWRPSASGETYERHNPMRPSEAVARVASANEEDAEAAVVAAQRAYPEWAALPLAKRGAYLNAAAAALEERNERVARDMVNEMGKPLREARAEAARGAQILRYAASQAFMPVGEHFEQAATGAQVSTRRRPVGIVALITPWNFPCAIPLWKLAPALMYGNTVVLKPAHDSPLTGLHIAECFAEASLPPGVLNVLTGRGATAGAALVNDTRVRALSFTGSVATGRSVRDEATKLGKRVQLELGGHNPLIITADADLDRAAEAAYVGAFWSAGQKCTATRRIYVHEDAYAAFSEKFLARIGRGKVGDPSDPEVEVGPIVNESQFNEIMDAIERGKSEGGHVLVGGRRADEHGYLIAPTVFEDVRDDAFLSCEEVFGPVTSLYRFSTLDEAMERANAGAFGLSAGIFTSSLAAATRFQNESQAGLIHVNSQTAGADVHVPFGGIKNSGFGPHEQGRAALEFYTDIVTIYLDA